MVGVVAEGRGAGGGVLFGQREDRGVAQVGAATRAAMSAYSLRLWVVHRPWVGAVAWMDWQEAGVRCVPL